MKGKFTAAGRVVRWSTIAAVVLVAAVAGVVSHDYALAVVRGHGESGAVVLLYPATIDGLVYSASMATLDAVRRGVPAPRLARWLLAFGIGATLAVNVASGLRFGSVGALVAARPALAVVTVRSACEKPCKRFPHLAGMARVRSGQASARRAIRK